MQWLLNEDKGMKGTLLLALFSDTFFSNFETITILGNIGRCDRQDEHVTYGKT